MSGEKEIRTKIRSVQNTQKITKAMEMVAASKMRRAQDRMAAAKPYATEMRRAIGHLGRANPEYKHPYTVEREDIKRVAYIVISSDRGLCGGLNMNLFRKILTELTEWDKKGVEVDVVTIGSKAISFFRRIGGNVVAKNSGLGDTPHLNDLIGSIKVLLDSYSEGKVDRVFLAGNEFVNTMTQAPTVRQLLPIAPVEDDDDELPELWDYLYEPDAIDILDSVLMRYVESQVYQGAVENVACEMAARMVAMKSASDNAGEIIDELQLAYNKVRQASITQELSEIVAGAAAV